MSKNTFLKIIFGFILVHFDFKLGTFDLLPNFLGYILILLSVYDFAKLSSGFRKFIVPCFALIIYHGITWIISFNISILPFIVAAVTIAFWFMFLTGIAALLRQFKQPKDADTLVGLRNLYAVFQLGFLLTTNLFYVPLLSTGLAMLSLLIFVVIPFMLSRFSQGYQ